ncbi:hypothetical protein EDI_256990 [Entamoeba dispar SAW760]|uniref:Uncharacterized protein n=1 Tax=Entamoeba dispar (strain ATCC PRA-260 / SAW760) TaxID=370354 RepID=B0EHN9_ENTDS|nr:uncharacterized protein EDI_256990 [Entamoeba dispar SAW760]EDR25973.1 hypothetical protein EDI_256990 [Entamoeba dispar SAW760]|eukprot:EDR25973.1 hypothetical protein EDI_256990 [Entamoeba dispar SAW760]
MEEDTYYSNTEEIEDELTEDENNYEQIIEMIKEANFCLNTVQNEREAARKVAIEKVQIMNELTDKIKKSIERQGEITDKLVQEKNEHAKVLEELQKHVSKNTGIHCTIETNNGKIVLTRAKDSVAIERDALFEKTIQLQRVIEEMKSEHDKNEQKIEESQRSTHALSEEIRSKSFSQQPTENKLDVEQIVKTFEKSKVGTKQLLNFIKICENKPVCFGLLFSSK